MPPKGNTGKTPVPRENARLNEALGLFRAGQTERALAGVLKVLEKAPGHADAHHFASAMLLTLNRPERALYHAERSVGLSPGEGRYWIAHGAALGALNRSADAVGAYERAVALRPDDPEAVGGLGAVYTGVGRYEEAEALLTRASALRPGWVDPVLTLATQHMNTARAHEAVGMLRGILAAHPGHLPAADTLALASSYDDQLSPAEAFECHRVFGRVAERVMRPVGGGAHANTRDPERRIRLAYLSAEFRDHSNSFFLRPILERHDRSRFEVVLYHTSRHEDGVTAEIKRHADRWVACDQMTPPELAQRIWRDRVDILVELTGHFARNRLAALAARPAPVQVTYLGYGNTTGLDSVDTRIIDHVTDPAPAADGLATERLVRLDRCFLTFRPDDDAPDPGEPAGDRPFTFGSFNDIKKISPPVVRAWSRVLRECPGSVLLVKTGELGHASMRAMLAARFEAEGIGADRLRLTGRVESDRGHLALYDEVDCGLDTFPYGGTTTTCQALWQGVPVVTLAGEVHAARVGASLLQAVGMEGWIARDEDGFVGLARRAFEGGRRSKADRDGLRARVAACELMDADGLVGELENAYDGLWRRWCQIGSAR